MTALPPESAVNPRVEELNEKQPEFVRPIWEYLSGAITAQRVERGRELIGEHFGLFRRLSDRFGVPPQILTAIWGIETGYGRTTGSFNLVEALANLAFEGPRADYGRRELLATLQIAQQQNLDPGQMTGSWAGAFGQTQFIPTTFLKYAVDGDGDGRIDLWSSSRRRISLDSELSAAVRLAVGTDLGRGGATAPGICLCECESFDPQTRGRMGTDWECMHRRVSTYRKGTNSRLSFCLRAIADRHFSSSTISMFC